MKLKDLKEKIESIENLVPDDTEVWVADANDDDGAVYSIQDVFVGKDDDIIILT